MGLELQPQAAPLYFARGVLYVSLAQYDKAEVDFQKAYELDPSQSLSAAAQALAAAQENDLDRALTKVQASLAQKPNDALLLYLQADISEPERRKLRARRSLKQRCARQPKPSHCSRRSARPGASWRNSICKRDEIRRQSNSVKRPSKAIRRIRRSCTTFIQGLRKTGKQDEIPELLKTAGSAS